MSYTSCNNCGRATTTMSAFTRHGTDVVICDRARCRDARRRAKRDYQEGRDVRV